MYIIILRQIEYAVLRVYEAYEIKENARLTHQRNRTK